MSDFSKILDELKTAIQFEQDNLLGDETRPKYLPSLKRLLTATGKPTKKLLEYNKKLLKEGKITNYIDQSKVYNFKTGRFVDALTPKKKQLKKKFQDTKKNIGSIVNTEHTPVSNQKYKKEIFNQFKNASKKLNQDSKVNIDLTKIKLLDILRLIKNSKLTQTHIISGKPINGKNWITFSPNNMVKLQSFQKLLGSDYTERFGSDLEFVFDSLKNKGFVLDIRPKGQGKKSGAFFKYYHKLNVVDFSRYGIYREAPKNYKKNCLYIALEQSGLSTEKLNKYLMYVKSGHVPVCNLQKIADHLDICIKLSTIKVYNNNGETHTDISYYGKKDNTICEICLYDQHYFINDKKTNITSYAVKNYNDIKDKKEWFRIIKNKGKKGYERANRFISSFELVQLLIKYKENLLVDIPVEDLMKTQYYTQTINDEDLSYDDDCCAENKVRTPVYDSNRHLYNIYYDFETDTTTDTHTPYLMCALTEENEKVDFVGDDCGKNFLEWIKRKFRNKKPIEGVKPFDKGLIQDVCLVAHNARYDFSFLMDHLKIRLEPILKGNRLMGGSARLYVDKGKWIKLVFHDSCNFLAMKLSKFHEVFEIEEKKEILPYDLYTTKNINDVYINKDICLKYVKEDDHEEYLDNCMKWNCINEDEIDIIEYSKQYCYMDCEVLKKGYETFRGWMLEITGLNINYYCSIASVALDYIIKEGCFDDCYKISGVPRNFIQKCVVGGRVMTRDNKKWKVEGKINDVDAVSLYPASMSRMNGFLKGKPSVILNKNKTFEWLNKNSDGFFVKVLCENNPTIKRSFPLLSATNEIGIRDFTNDTKGKIFYIDKTTYEDCVKFQGLKFKILCGYYYDKGHNNTINGVIRYLFNERIKAKKNKNPIQAVYKLLMNSCYGKALLKPIDSDTKVVNKNTFDQYLQRNYNFISEYTELKDQYVVKQIKTIDTHFNNVYAGVEILSMSKRLMNEVICLAEDNNLKIYYQDTDSIHINDADISVLQKKFNKEYNREMIGKDLGQFHSDFELDNCNNVYSKKAIFLGKKCYLDCLVGEDSNGNIQEGFHIRMKGVNKEGIYHHANMNNITIDNIYEKLYNGDKLEFDLLAGGELCKFKYNKDMSVSTVSDFTRSVSFNYQEGIIV